MGALELGPAPDSIGANVEALSLGVWQDRHRTPYSFWRRELTPGVELVATATLNLLNRDWLRRVSTRVELLIVLGSGALFGAGLCLLRRGIAEVLAIIGILLVFASALWGTVYPCTWFSWLVVGAIQIPVALVWSLRPHGKEILPAHEPSASGGLEALPTPTRLVSGASERGRTSPAIPDHVVLRQVGKGSYGEVWLARNAVGLYHAVKVVYREAFQDAEPYEREFRGIQNFMPLSRNHPNLVHLLHVGRIEAQGYFFYIMESADDQAAGQQVDPETYSPKHLGVVLRSQRRLPVEQCVRLGLDLASALAFLHAHELVHRDIKPSNIIYVRGVPKVADIGLVTDIGGKGKATTYLGTEGYIPPEGPGTPGADIYSLGKVLYEAATGFDRLEFPGLPTSLVAQPEDSWVQLNQIILKACEPDSAKRYQSATDLQRDLLALNETMARRTL